MEQTASSADIARQTLIQLAKKSQPPTPDNFTRVYHEIAGLTPKDTDTVGQILQDVLLEIGEKNAAYLTLEKSIRQSIDTQQWSLLKSHLQQLLQQHDHRTTPVDWASLIRDLLKQLETSHKGITLSRKKEGLSRVLTNFSKDPNVLHQKIQALSRAWKSEPNLSNPADATIANAENRPEHSLPATLNLPNNAPNQAIEDTLWRELLLKTLELALIPALSASSEALQKAQALHLNLQNAAAKEASYPYVDNLKSVLLAVEIERDTTQKTQQSVIDLLRLLTENMGELVLEDPWFKGQMHIINDILAQPVNLQNLHDAQNSLRQLFLQQANLKPALQEAKELLKKMAVIFMERLVEMTENTSDYHEKIQSHQKKLSGIAGINELNHVLADILDDTKHIGISVQRSRDAFDESQQKVLQAEQKIQDLTTVLDRIAQVANQDYLTGTLNRRGMDEALAREINRADRHHTALSIAMMDIDHFKQLNDRFGHATGDEALTHFAKIFSQLKRSTDVIARYGGEEFMIILPDTAQSLAISAIQRVQRDLTKKFFMHNNARIMITFSAGVAERQPDESIEQVMARADAALYQAKQTGRNRVIGALAAI